MADLRLIKELHAKFKPATSPFKYVDFDKKELTEAINPDRIEKAITNKVAELGPAFTMYFDLGFPANLALLFIDICSFSTKYENFKDEELAEFLDTYYEIVLPIIYEHGGEVDKIMGDGIICLFGAPFLSDELTKNIALAYKCSKVLIKATNESAFESKIALHAGQIRYYKNSSIHYEEYTIVGKIMTELFRLESISEDGKINFYTESAVGEYISSKIPPQTVIPKFPEVIAKWRVSKDKPITPRLKGVDFDKYRTVSNNKF